METVSMNDLENAKENFAPVRGGRDAMKLKEMASFAGKPSELALKMKQASLKFEEDLKNYTGDDPLEIWHNYIKLLADSSSDITSKRTDLLPTLEKGTLEFKDTEKYKNDHRYLKMWMRYAELCSDSLDIFSWLRANKIGQSWALFYESWAAVLEAAQNYNFADAVYREGISLNATPVSRLQSRYDAFLVRWNKAVPERHVPADENGRPRLATISSFDVPVQVQKQVHSNTVQSNKPSFEVYEDFGTSAAPKSHLPAEVSEKWNLGTQKERSKENFHMTSWLKFSLPPVKALPSAPTFEVYEDSKETSFVKPVSSKPVNHSVPTAVTSFPAAEPGCIRAYKESVLFVNGEELSFEEVRAQTLITKKEVVTCTLEENEDDIEMGDYTIHPSSKENKIAPNTTSSTITAFTNSHVEKKYSFPSPTINTKAALQDVLSIFEETTLNFSKISHATPSQAMSAYTLHHKLSSLYDPDNTTSSKPQFLVFEDHNSESDNYNANNNAFEVYNDASSKNSFEVFEDIPTSLNQVVINDENLGVVEKTIFKPRELSLLPNTEEPISNSSSNHDDDAEIRQNLIPDYQSESKYTFEIFEDQQIQTDILKSEAPTKKKTEMPSYTGSFGGLPTILETSRESDISFLSSNSGDSIKNNTMAENNSTGKSENFPQILEDVTEDGILVADPFDINERNAALEAVSVLELPNAMDCRHMECPIIFEDSSTDLELAGRYFQISSKFSTSLPKFNKSNTMFALTVQDLMADDVSLSNLLLSISRPASLWEFYMQHQMLERFSKSSDWNVLKRIFVLQREMLLFKDASCIVASSTGQPTLSALLNMYNKKGQRMHESIACFYSIELLRIMIALIEHSFVHCNIHPLSILLRNEESEHTVCWGDWNPSLKGGWIGKGLGLFNFRDIIDCSLYPPQTQFMGYPEESKLLVMCPDMIAHQPWLYQQDAYGVANCIHLMIHGVDLELSSTESKNSMLHFAPKLALPNGYQEFWNAAFEVLLNVPAVNSLAKFVELKSTFESYLSNTENVSRLLKVHLCQQNIMLADDF